MQGFKYVAWISRIVSEMSLRTRSHVSEYVWIRNFFFPDSKISMSRRIRINIGFARIPILSTTQDSSGNIGNRACVVVRAEFAPCSASREPGNEVDILITVFTVKN